MKFSIDEALKGLKRGAEKFGTKVAAKLVTRKTRTNGFTPLEPEPYGAGVGGAETGQDSRQNAEEEYKVQKCPEGWEVVTRDGARAGEIFEAKAEADDRCKKLNGPLGRENAGSKAKKVFDTLSSHIGRDWSPDPVSLQLMERFRKGLKDAAEENEWILDAQYIWPELKNDDGGIAEAGLGYDSAEKSTTEDTGMGYDAICQCPACGFASVDQWSGKCPSCGVRNEKPVGMRKPENSEPSEKANALDAGELREHLALKYTQELLSGNYGAELQALLEKGAKALGWDVKRYADQARADARTARHNSADDMELEKEDYPHDTGAEGRKADRELEEKQNASSCPECKGPLKPIGGGPYPAGTMECEACDQAWAPEQLKNSIKNAGHLGPDAWEAATDLERTGWLEAAGQDLALLHHKWADLSLDSQVALQDAFDMPVSANNGGGAAAAAEHGAPSVESVEADFGGKALHNAKGDRLSGADCTCGHAGSKHYDTGHGEACSSCSCEVYGPAVTCRKCGQKERQGVAVGGLCEECQNSKENADGKPGRKKFVFKDVQGEEETIEATSLDQAWDQLANIFGTPVSEIKRMGVKFVREIQNANGYCSDCSKNLADDVKDGNPKGSNGRCWDCSVAHTDKMEKENADTGTGEEARVQKYAKAHEAGEHKSPAGGCPMCEMKNDATGDVAEIERHVEGIEHELGEMKDEGSRHNTSGTERGSKKYGTTK